ncbi:MAG: hypothetical protein ACRDWS_08835 [Acidimicrobiia bacterium]
MHQGVDVGPFEELVDVDASDETLDVDTIEQGVDVDPVEQGIHVDMTEHHVGVDHLQHPLAGPPGGTPEEPFALADLVRRVGLRAHREKASRRSFWRGDIDL